MSQRPKVTPAQLPGAGCSWGPGILPQPRAVQTEKAWSLGLGSSDDTFQGF